MSEVNAKRLDWFKLTESSVSQTSTFVLCTIWVSRKVSQHAQHVEHDGRWPVSAVQQVGLQFCQPKT